MKPDDVLRRLVAIFPAFGPYWDRDDLFREADGSFTFCGVFAVFSSFVRESAERLPAASLGELGQFLDECMREPGNELDTSTATCFLENIQGEPADRILREFLNGNALRFLQQFER